MYFIEGIRGVGVSREVYSKSNVLWIFNLVIFVELWRGWAVEGDRGDEPWRIVSSLLYIWVVERGRCQKTTTREFKV